MRWGDFKKDGQLFSYFIWLYQSGCLKNPPKELVNLIWDMKKVKRENISEMRWQMGPHLPDSMKDFTQKLEMDLYKIGLNLTSLHLVEFSCFQFKEKFQRKATNKRCHIARGRNKTFHSEKSTDHSTTPLQ